MRDLLILFVHSIVTVARLARPGGLRSVVAESILVRHQLLVLNRGRKRAPKLRTDRIIAGLCTLFMLRARVLRSAIVLKPSTLLHFHSVMRKRKYRMLFSHQGRRRPGPKGPNKNLIDAVVAMKRRNPSWGCPRIAQQIALAFGVDIDKDAVRRVLRVHYRPEPDSGGPSWLTFIGHMKDSLWSCDLFRCESATLKTHWVLVVMDQFTRRVIGFGVHSGIVDGVALCRMFHQMAALQSAMITASRNARDQRPVIAHRQVESLCVTIGSLSQTRVTRRSPVEASAALASSWESILRTIWRKARKAEQSSAGAVGRRAT